MNLLLSALLALRIPGLCAQTIAAACLFYSTGGVQPFTIPSNITAIQFSVAGAGGGFGAGGCGTPGKGGALEGTLSVTPGQILYLFVGGAGRDNGGGGGKGAGWNGGGGGNCLQPTPPCLNGAGGNRRGARARPSSSCRDSVLFVQRS